MMDLRGNFKVYGKFCSCKNITKCSYLRMKLLYLFFFWEIFASFKKSKPHHHSCNLRKKALSLCTLIRGTMKASNSTKELHNSSLRRTRHMLREHIFMQRTMHVLGPSLTLSASHQICLLVQVPRQGRDPRFYVQSSDISLPKTLPKLLMKYVAQV